MNVQNSTERWRHIKPLFLRLYINEKKTLDEVREELARYHSFVASEKAFKYHIRRWQAYKSYKSSDKEELHKQKILLQESGKPPGTLLFRGKPVKWDRVERHRKAKVARPRRQVAVQLNPVGNNQLKLQVQKSIAPSLTDASEILLAATGEYLRWEQWTCIQHPNRRLEDKLYTDLITGIQTLRHPSLSSRGWQMVHKSCRDIAAAVEVNIFQVWQIMVSIVNMHVAIRDRRLVDSIFRYIRGLVMIALPQRHPLRVALSRISDPNRLHSIVKKMTDLKTDLLLLKPAMFGFPSYFSLLWQNAFEQLDFGYYSAGFRIMSALLTSMVLNVRQQIELGSLVAEGHLRMGNYEAVVSTCKNDIDRILQNPQAAGSIDREWARDMVSLHYFNMGHAYHKMGAVELSIAAYQTAFEEMLALRGRGDSWVIQCLHQLENILIEHGKTEELNMLRTKYWYMYRGDYVPEN